MQILLAFSMCFFYANGYCCYYSIFKSKFIFKNNIAFIFIHFLQRFTSIITRDSDHFVTGVKRDIEEICKAEEFARKDYYHTQTAFLEVQTGWKRVALLQT